MDHSVFLVLNYLDIFKSVEADSLKVLGLSGTELQAILEDLSERGLVKKSGELIEISELGEHEAERCRRELLENSHRKDEFLKYCVAFEEMNKRFKDLVTRWQLKEVEGELVPNDHLDPEYDMAILEGLSEVHEETVKLLRKMSEIFPFFKGYIQRFENALSRLMNGDLGYMADSDKQSYHTVWFELHETLLKMSGMKRVE